MTETFTPLHINYYGHPDYTIPLTLEYRQEAGWWLGQCKETGDGAFVETLEITREELESNILHQLSELESLGHLPRCLQQWGIPPSPYPPADPPRRPGRPSSGMASSSPPGNCRLKSAKPPRANTGPKFPKCPAAAARA